MEKSNLQLVGKPQIAKISYETNKEYVFKDELLLEISNNIQVVKDSDEKKCKALIVLGLGIFTAKEFAEVPFKMDLVIEGLFSWDEGLSKDSTQLDNMLKQNAPAILYSYLRPIITLISVEANMPPLVIPLMNFCE